MVTCSVSSCVSHDELQWRHESYSTVHVVELFSGRTVDNGERVPYYKDEQEKCIVGYSTYSIVDHTYCYLVAFKKDELNVCR